MMKCSKLRFELALFADGGLSSAENSVVENHLQVCPLCRQALSEHRSVGAQMRRIRRVELPNSLRMKIRESVIAEVGREKRAWMPISSELREWFQMRVIPYGVGAFASVIIGFTFLTMMFSGMLAQKQGQATVFGGDTSILLASNRAPYADVDAISPVDFARSRMSVAGESPSMNPQGALVELTKSFLRGGVNDEEVVVVADVYSNGLAQVTEVVEPSHDRKAVAQLEKALGSDVAYAPFVPASMDDRPQSMRVVLKFQSVNVSTGLRRGRVRL